MAGPRAPAGGRDRRRGRARARRPAGRAAADGDRPGGGGRHRSRRDRPAAAGSRDASTCVDEDDGAAGSPSPSWAPRCGRTLPHRCDPRRCSRPIRPSGRRGGTSHTASAPARTPSRAKHGTDIWAHRAEHPEHNASFNALMASRSEEVAGAVAASYDFSGLGARRGRRWRPGRAPRRGAPGVPAPDRHACSTRSTWSPTCRRPGSSRAGRPRAGRSSQSVPPADGYLLKSILARLAGRGERRDPRSLSGGPAPRRRRAPRGDRARPAGLRARGGVLRPEHARGARRAGTVGGGIRARCSSGQGCG